MEITILSDVKKYSGGQTDFFPLYKWQNELLKNGFKLNFCYSIEEIKCKTSDLYILSNRFNYGNRENLKNLILFLKIKNKVALFDAVDTSGSVDFDLISLVDVIIKKQVFKDKSKYLHNNYDLSVRPWLQELPINSNYLDYSPCPEDAINKIKIGWNIGLCDYRFFSSYSRVLKNYLISDKPENNRILNSSEKNLICTFRGAAKYGNPQIEFQRNEVIKIFLELNNPRIITGSILSKKKYLNELNNTLIGISPFGWGEICFRDFELFYAKSICIKPSMEHIDTYPNFYIKNFTYKSIDWNMENLGHEIIEIYKDYDNNKRIAINAYNLFMEHQNNFILFEKHFKELILSIIEER